MHISMILEYCVAASKRRRNRSAVASYERVRHTVLPLYPHKSSGSLGPAPHPASSAATHHHSTAHADTTHTTADVEGDTSAMMVTNNTTADPASTTAAMAGDGVTASHELQSKDIQPYPERRLNMGIKFGPDVSYIY